MLITLMFSVVPMKSRTFSGFSHSANEQVGRSWEGAQPGRQPTLADGSMPYCKCDARFRNGDGPEGRNLSCLFSGSSNPLLSGCLNFSGSLIFLGGVL